MNKAVILYDVIYFIFFLCICRFASVESRFVVSWNDFSWRIPLNSRLNTSKKILNQLRAAQVCYNLGRDSTLWVFVLQKRRVSKLGCIGVKCKELLALFFTVKWHCNAIWKTYCVYHAKRWPFFRLLMFKWW